MKYEQLAGVDSKISRLVYGTGVAKMTGDDEGLAFSCLDLAWEAGFRIFDTAYRYGHAEENLGKWLIKTGHRDEAVILDKGCNPGQHGCLDVFSADTIRKQVKESQERLQTDHVELYILHRDDESKPVDEIVEVLNECKDKGYFQRFGGSNWRKYRIEQANAYAASHGLEGFSILSPNYNMLKLARDPWGGSISLSTEDGEMKKWLEDNQMPVFNYSALARGYLSGKMRSDQVDRIEELLPPSPIKEYHCPENLAKLARAEKIAQDKGCTVSQIGLAWLFSEKMNLFPIVSPTTEGHIRDNVGALDIVLSSQEKEYLERG